MTWGFVFQRTCWFLAACLVAKWLHITIFGA